MMRGNEEIKVDFPPVAQSLGPSADAWLGAPGPPADQGALDVYGCRSDHQL